MLHRSSTTQSGKPLKPEYLFCKVWEGNSPPIFVAVIYKPPDVPLKTDRRLLSTIRSCCSEYSHKVIMGDWNLDMSNTQNSYSRYICKYMEELSLKMIQTGPTHHTGDKHTQIDLIFTDASDTVLDSTCTSSTFHNNHDIISVTIE